MLVNQLEINGYCANFTIKVFLFVTNISYNRVNLNSTSSIVLKTIELITQKA
ncbi:hypothetical protein HMPREF0531_10232 [Lactiplantibacillus plantarum subsp. plantarum ATCC 14917 = JCM 1149 = CGMCC 1.2437]|nr:hypothetical protein HMPREF0531_10232 [Lactiplantibacillus plantarum subsp. plantarum ATCC 14917 = JCM 1149 = CGMCC 1.2437]ERO41925.1 hypothetical protein LPLWJ_10110 [Lactiplantibacillus plantarum WJL]